MREIIDGQKGNLKQIDEKIENINETLSKRVEEYNEERKQQTAELVEKVEQNKETIVQVRACLLYTSRCV